MASDFLNALSGIAVNRLSEKRRSFKRGLWGSCVATLMPHKGDSVIEARCSLSSLIPFQRRERSILNGLSAAQTKPPACAGGFVQFANKVLIALP
jgi:hypothetical protein